MEIQKMYIQHSIVNIHLELLPLSEEKIRVMKLELLPDPIDIHAEDGNEQCFFSDVRNKIHSFLDGTLKDLHDFTFNLDSESDFAINVLRLTQKIPWGTVVSYQELAKESGNRGAARAVAQVLRRNRFPLLIPCHRVIKSDGTIGGFSGQRTGRFVTMKQKLLAREGVRIEAFSF